MLRLVVDGVASHQPRIGIVGVGIEVVGCVVGLIDATVVVEFQRVDETGHGHIFVFQPRSVFLCLALGCQQTVGSSLSVDGDSLSHVEGIGLLGFGTGNFGIVRTAGKGGLLLQVVFVELASFFSGLLLFLFAFLALGFFLLRGHSELLGFNLFVGHRNLAIESEVEAVGEEDVLVVVAVPVFLQHGRNLGTLETLVETLRMHDVFIVGDAAVLSDFLMICRHQQVGFIAVAEIAAVHRVVEVGGTLRVVVAASVDVVEVKAEAEPLSGIHAELRGEVVVAIRPVATLVVAQVRERRQGVGEMKIARLCEEIVVGLCEEEMAVGLSVDEYPVDAGCSLVASRIVFSTQTLGEGGVHIHIRKGVWRHGGTVAKLLVDRPRLHAFGDFLVAFALLA